MTGLKFQEVVWSAVIAVALGIGTLVAAVLGNELAATSCGLVSLTAAVLSVRERV